jgi:hypothetical protein
MGKTKMGSIAIGRVLYHGGCARSVRVAAVLSRWWILNQNRDWSLSRDKCHMSECQAYSSVEKNPE